MPSGAANGNPPHLSLAPAYAGLAPPSEPGLPKTQRHLRFRNALRFPLAVTEELL